MLVERDREQACCYKNIDTDKGCICNKKGYISNNIFYFFLIINCKLTVVLMMFFF